jgi:hypothetical protein
MQYSTERERRRKYFELISNLKKRGKGVNYIEETMCLVN